MLRTNNLCSEMIKAQTTDVEKYSTVYSTVIKSQTVDAEK